MRVLLGLLRFQLLLLGLLLVSGRWVLVVLVAQLLVLGRLVGWGDLDHDIGWLTDNFGLESLLGVSGVGDSSDESIGIDDGVAALDHAIIADLLPVLVVGKLVVFNVKAELVGGADLRRKESKELK